MTSDRPESTMHELDTAPWRKSSFSGDQGVCVETAPLADGRIAVRSSPAPRWTPGSRDARPASSTTSGEL
jgi:hypothetical protein